MARRGRGRMKGPIATHAIPVGHAYCNHGNFKDVKSLFQPAWSREKRRRYVCVCGMKFGNRNNFCNHQQNMKHYDYEGWRPMWICGVCGQWTVTQGLLIRHIRGCHSCLRCGKIKSF